ncbi:hypothetical protein Ari01nite_63510 [Paractinoplanes rishiriensis]|uniref:DUF5317 domain-containing protein n=2 Tax=Paractinoplanes rishiriensis TaxID=1050105 RepID=A0A919MT47_9ACTN|nr:hypothetical protein Ari01nite_63510 [Actinoplanes rishiriensis]
MPSPLMLLLMSLPLAVAIAVAIVVTGLRTGGLRTGGLRALLRLRLRHRWLVGAAAAVQLVRLTDPAWAAAVLRPWRGALPVIAIWVLVVAFAIANVSTLHGRARAAMALFVTGMSMNFAAIVANGGMPFSVPAARRAGFTEAEIGTDVLGHPPLTPGSRLTPLADVIPLPGLHIVASAGDVLIFAGLVWLLLSSCSAGASLTQFGREPQQRPEDQRAVAPRPTATAVARRSGRGT